jgi:hypothetical protein
MKINPGAAVVAGGGHHYAIGVEHHRRNPAPVWCGPP